MNFSGLVERIYEYVALLSFILGLPVTDALYLDSKVAGSYMVRSKEKEFKQFLRKRKLFPFTEKLLWSNWWKEVSKLKQRTHNAINRSIDVTIVDDIERDVFNMKLQEFLREKIFLKTFYLTM